MGGLGGPRAVVDAQWHLCCGAVVGGQFAVGRQLVFQHSLSLLVRWVAAWGAVAGGRRGGGVGVPQTGPVAAGVRVYSSVSHL